MSFKIPGFDDFDKNETDKDLSDPLGDISLDDDFYGISNNAKSSSTKVPKEDHSKKIANIFGLADSPSVENAPPKLKEKSGPAAGASDWLGLKNSPSPQKKSLSSQILQQKSTNQEEDTVFGSQTQHASNFGVTNTRRKSEAPSSQSKKDKPMPEYKSLDMGDAGQADLGGDLPRGVQIKENLMDPARGSRRSSLKVDSLLNSDLASVTEDWKKRKQDGENSEYNSLDMDKPHLGSLNTGAVMPQSSEHQKAKDARNQQTKDDLSSFFSMPSAQSRRPGLSRRRETSPNPIVPTPLVEPTDQTYDWLGSSSGQNSLTRKKEFGLPSWLMGPEDNTTDANIKTNSDANKGRMIQDSKSMDTPIATQSKTSDTSATTQSALQANDTTNPSAAQTTSQTENQMESSDNHPEDNAKITVNRPHAKPSLNIVSESQDDPLIKDLELSVGSILDIRSYNKIVQDQNRMINLLIKQQSGYMSQLIHKIASATQGGEGETKLDEAEAGNHSSIKIADLLAEKETLELELKHARMRFEHAVLMLESKCKDTVAMVEEKCSHRIAMMEEELKGKLEKWRQLEAEYKQRAEDVGRERDELVTWYKRRLEEIQQEYSGEIKTLREHMELLKAQHTEEKASKQLRMPSNETEWSEREVELMEKEKKLQEQDELLKAKCHQLEERRKEIDNEREQFEMIKFRDQSAMNAETKRLKRAHSLLVIEQETWEEEVSKEREQVKKMRHALEKMRDNLQREQEELGAQQLKIATEKSKMDVLLKMNSGVDLIQSKAEADGMMQVAMATIASVKDTKEKLQDEKARLMDLEQEVTLRERMAEKLIRMSEQKQAEGLDALEDSRRLEASFKHKAEAIQQQLAELSIREHKLAKEKFEIQREKEMIERRKEKLFAFLPDVDSTYQQPTIIDPRSIITKLRAEKDIEND